MNGPAQAAPFFPPLPKLFVLSHGLHGHQTFALNVFPVWSLQDSLWSGLRVTSPFASLAAVEWGWTCTHIASRRRSGGRSKAVPAKEISPPFCFSAGGPLTNKGKKTFQRQLTLGIMFRRVQRPVLQACNHCMGAEYLPCAQRPQQMQTIIIA